MPDSCSGSSLNVPSVDRARDNPRRRCRTPQRRRKGANGLALCANDRPATSLLRAPPAQCSASWPANPPAEVRFHFLRRTDSTTHAVRFLVPTQPVRAKQPRESVIAGSNRAPVRHSSPEQPINLFHCVDFCFNNPHDFHVTAPSSGLRTNAALYDPVVLATRAGVLECHRPRLRDEQTA